MLMVPEVKVDNIDKTNRALTELEIQEKLYGSKLPNKFETGIHPQLAQAKIQIGQLEEEIKMTEERETELRARIEELDKTLRENEKRLARSERDRDKLERRITQLTSEAAAQQSANWQKARGVIQNGIKRFTRRQS